MLRVEVFVPSLEQSYDFVLNEYARIPEVIDEIASVISTREQRPWISSESDFLLCDASAGLVLPREKTLYQCKVSPGSKLVLV